MKPRNIIGNSQGQGVQYWMASCLVIARTHRRNIILLFTHFLIPSFTIVTIGETPNSRYFNSQFIPQNPHFVDRAYCFVDYSVFMCFM